MRDEPDEPDDRGLGFVHVYEPGSGPAAGDTLLLLHGTGGNERDLLPLGRTLAPGAALLSARGQVLESGMPRYFRRLSEGVFDEADLVARSADLSEFIIAAGRRYGFDPSRLVAVGFSNGANIAAAVLLLHPGVLNAAALFAPMLPLRPPALPDLTGTAVFVNVGRGDRITPPDRAVALAEILVQAGATVDVRWHDGGHGVDVEAVTAAGEWYAHLRAEGMRQSPSRNP